MTAKKTYILLLREIVLYFIDYTIDAIQTNIYMTVWFIDYHLNFNVIFCLIIKIKRLYDK